MDLVKESQSPFWNFSLIIIFSCGFPIVPFIESLVNYTPASPPTELYEILLIACELEEHLTNRNIIRNIKNLELRFILKYFINCVLLFL